MGSRRSARGALFVVLLGFGSLSRAALADDLDAGTRMAARELAMSGAEAFDQQDYAKALDRFQRAESLYQVPSIAIMVARCLAKVGRVVEAVDKYEETLRAPLAADAPEAFQRAVADAKVEVERARARVARLELRLPAEPPGELEVKLDERPLPKALLGVPVPVDPGLHQIVARAPGRERYRDEVTLAEGERLAVEISLPTLKRPAAPPPEPSKAQSSRGGPSTLTLALLGGGGVAIGAGAFTGVVALNRKSSLDDACTPGCPTRMSSDLDSFRLNRTLSYVGFGVGIAAAGAGAYLLLHEGSSGSQMGALVLPGGAGLTGSF